MTKVVGVTEKATMIFGMTALAASHNRLRNAVGGRGYYSWLQGSPERRRLGAHPGLANRRGCSS
jgi:hypothetical protein